MVQRLTGIGHQTENLAVAFALLAMSLLPVLEMLLRGLFNLGLPGSIGYVQNLTLWVGFLGAIIASRERRHLNLATAKLVLPAGLKPAIEAATAVISVAVSACLFWASLQFVMSEMADPVRIGGWLPLWCMEAVLPLSFLVITLRFVTQAGRLAHQVVAVSGIPLAALVGLFLAPYAQDLVWPGLIVLLAAAVLGAPIFVALGGTALVLFFAAGVPIAAIPVETYRIVVSPAIPSIPLFTLTGLPARRKRREPASAAAVPGAVRLDARRLGDRDDPGLRLFRDLHRRLGRRHSCPRRPAAADPVEGRPAGGLLARPLDGHRLDRPAVPPEPGRDPLWRPWRMCRSPTSSWPAWCRARSWSAP